MSISSFRQALLRDIIIGQKKKTTNVLKSTVLRGSVCSEDYSWLWDDEIGCDWYNHAVHKSCTGYNSTMYFFCNGRIFFFFCPIHRYDNFVELIMYASQRTKRLKWCSAKLFQLSSCFHLLVYCLVLFHHLGLFSCLM